jgi:hypothetical protein
MAFDTPKTQALPTVRFEAVSLPSDDSLTASFQPTDKKSAGFRHPPRSRLDISTVQDQDGKKSDIRGKVVIKDCL